MGFMRWLLEASRAKKAARPERYAFRASPEEHVNEPVPRLPGIIN
jgi:hypothetical protein